MAETWRPCHDHSKNHGKHGNHTMNHDGHGKKNGKPVNFGLQQFNANFKKFYFPSKRFSNSFLIIMTL